MKVVSLFFRQCIFVLAGIILEEAFLPMSAFLPFLREGGMPVIIILKMFF